MLLNDLEELEDITNTLIFEEPETIFDEETALQLLETAFHLMDEYMKDNPGAITEPDFCDILLEEIIEIFNIQFEDHIYNNEQIEEDMLDLIKEAFEIYITTFHTERSLENSEIYNFNKSNNEHIKNRIQYLKSIPQPVQRTSEWYEFRHNLITASNAYKAFESQSKINELIYEKCQPVKQINEELEDYEVKMVNTNTPFHWGQKYEPLSVMIYENKYKTKIDDFGCIQHDKYSFLGASPDGINIDENSEKYGRMLEIKNIVNREINGIPKKEYWVQMQLQMEVCDLDECDFLETKFIEYSDYESYKNDAAEDKGIIIYFHTKEGKPFYAYKPIDLKKDEDVLQWEDENVNKYQSEPYNYTYMKFIYWKLEKLSCVLVLRNKDWFKNSVKALEEVWQTIEKERLSGYEHRAPNRKVKKDSLKPFIEIHQNVEGQSTLLNFIKNKGQN